MAKIWESCSPPISTSLNYYQYYKLKKNCIFALVNLYTFPFKDTTLDSVDLNPSDIFPKQNRVGKLIFLFSALNLIISFLFTKNNYYRYNKLKRNCVFALVKLIQNFFSGEPKLSLIPKVGPLPSMKSYF